MSHPPLREAVALTPSEIETAVSRLDTKFAPARMTHVQLPGKETSYFHIWLDDGTEAMINATDLAILEHGGIGRSTLAVVESLHTHLLLEDGGKFIVGIGGLIMLVVLLAAGFTWMPFARHTRLNDLRPRRPSRARLNAFHRTSGSIVWVPAMLVALSGVMMAFGDASATVLRGLFGGEPYPSRPEFTECPASPAPLSQQIRAAEREVPDAGLTLLIRPDQCRRAPGYRFSQPGEWHPNGTTFIYLDPESLSPVLTFSATSLGLGTDISKRLFPLHAGLIGSPVLTPVLAVCGAVLAMLSISGFVTFFQWLLGRRRTSPARRVARFNVEDSR